MKKILIILFISFPLFAHEELAEINIHENLDDSLPLSRINKQSVVKKEVITNTRIQHKNATSLARAVDLEPGVQSVMTCANCGSLRLTLNGLRGENTTVMIDGIPAFSSVSSFYGMEAVPMSGLGRIEIMRGAGASLTAPEAIGGVVNLVTAPTDKNYFSYQVRGGAHEFFNQQFVGSYGNSQGGTLISAQTNQMSYFDEDNNHVAESSRQLQKSWMIKKDNRLGDKLKVSGRVGYQELELIGGTTQNFKAKNAPLDHAEETDFTNGDVRKKFNGESNKISDWIRLKRLDGGGSLTYHLSDDLNVKGAFALAKQEQLSTYFHGYDYDNRDMFRFFDLKVNKVAGENHFLTFGVDHRNEEMTSNSDVLFRMNDFKRDSFKFDTLGMYIQDEWTISGRDEINIVFRADRMKVNWDDKRITNHSLEKTAFAPRIHYKRAHSDTLTSRFSYGVGYRAPLTLFESQHGANEEGFELNITELEKAQTFSYTINRETNLRSSAFSAVLTRLENMAFAAEEYEPLIFRNAAKTMDIGTLNFIHVERMNSRWNLEASFDWFILPDEYKRKLPIAAQETRARLISDYHFGRNELVGFINVIGPRDLEKYDYKDNFNVMTNGIPSNRKGQYAPTYLTLDLFLAHHFTKNLDGVLGVNNLLDYTQTKAKESPLSWRTHGEHTHLDNRHIWGPLQGRVLYAGLKAEI